MNSGLNLLAYTGVITIKNRLGLCAFRDTALVNFGE